MSNSKVLLALSQRTVKTTDEQAIKLADEIEILVKRYVGQGCPGATAALVLQSLAVSFAEDAGRPVTDLAGALHAFGVK